MSSGISTQRILSIHNAMDHPFLHMGVLLGGIWVFLGGMSLGLLGGIWVFPWGVFRLAYPWGTRGLGAVGGQGRLFPAVERMIIA